MKSGFEAEKRLPPICANLWRLGIEMILKAGIIKMYKVQSIDEANDLLNEMRLVYGHDISLLWSDFKKYYPNQQCDEFDNVISELAPWWNIRYPRLEEQQVQILRDGKEIRFAAHTNFQLTPLKTYKLDAGRVDALYGHLHKLFGQYTTYEISHKK